MANPITLVLQVPPMAVGGGGEVGGDMLDMMILSVLPVPLAVAVVEAGMERGEDIVADKVADYIIGDMVGGRGRYAGSGTVVETDGLVAQILVPQMHVLQLQVGCSESSESTL